MISFEEDIFDRLREMGGNKSQFVNSAVAVALEVDGDKPLPICEYCGSDTTPFLFIVPDEKLACQKCENRLRKYNRVNLGNCKVA